MLVLFSQKLGAAIAHVTRFKEAEYTVFEKMMLHMKVLEFNFSFVAGPMPCDYSFKWIICLLFGGLSFDDKEAMVKGRGLLSLAECILLMQFMKV